MSLLLLPWHCCCGGGSCGCGCGCCCCRASRERPPCTVLSESACSLGLPQNHPPAHVPRRVCTVCNEGYYVDTRNQCSKVRRRQRVWHRARLQLGFAAPAGCITPVHS